MSFAKDRLSAYDAATRRAECSLYRVLKPLVDRLHAADAARPALDREWTRCPRYELIDQADRLQRSMQFLAERGAALLAHWPAAPSGVAYSPSAFHRRRRRMQRHMPTILATLEAWAAALREARATLGLAPYQPQH